MPKGVGTIITETISSFGIRSHGCGCTELANELNSVGPDVVEANLEKYVDKFRNSIKKWRRNNTRLIPTPPDLVLREFLLYAVAKARG